MEDLFITTYRGMSCVSGSISAELLFKFIRGDVYRNRIQRLREAEAEGDFTKADRMKKQLPYFTMTATYQLERLAYSMIKYQDIITLDFDSMRKEDLADHRIKANACPDTLANFISPRMHGLKLLVYPTSDEAQKLRAELNAQKTIDMEALDEYHHKMFDLASEQYAKLFNCEIDSSGKDLSRGFFASHDPDAFLSLERLNQVKPLEVNLKLPTKEECKKKKGKKKAPVFFPIAMQPNETLPDLQTQHEFYKALEYTRRKHHFEEGDRDNFLYCLGNQCYRRLLSEEDAVALTRSKFGAVPDFDFEQPFRNGYLYTSKTDKMEEEKQEPKIFKVIKFMDENYEIRRNIVKEQIEFRPKTEATPNKKPSSFITLRTKDINTFYINAQMKGVYCSQTYLKAIVDSDYAKPFNPFTHYFFSLPAWDGKTDYIAQLAATVKAVDQAFFEDSLRHWLVGMVACAINDDVQNHQLLLLYGEQGKGKSFFIRRLLPPELKSYCRHGMIRPDKTDHLLQLSSCLIIDLDEFDSISPWHMQDLKRLIIQDEVTERKVYDIQTYNYVRRASFIASTNNPHCLQDIKENRRILFNSILNVNYHVPLNYEGIYAQALALYRQGFQYWYEKEEITFLNNRNENFRLKDPVEENLFFYFHAAKGGEINAQWYPASHILSMLSMNGRTQSNQQAQKILVTVLEKNDFHKRVTPNGVTEYQVVEYSPEERNAHAVLPQHPKQQNFSDDFQDS